jgi:prolyl oligopeptidase
MNTKLIKSIIPIVCMLAACSNSNKFPQISVNYPVTEKDSVVDDYFGTRVFDPYRWLEDDNSPKTLEWVKKENQATYDYLNQIPFRHLVRQRLDSIANFKRYTVPFKKNGQYYYFKNTGLQNQSVLYVANSKTDNGEVFIDPNTFSKDGTTSLGGVMEFSDNGKYLAYTLSEGGSDWQKIVVIDAGTKKIVGDTIFDVKFTGITWNKNEGFYYSRYDKPIEGSVLSAMTQYHKVYYHKLGTPQASDLVVFGDKEIKRRYVGCQLFKNSGYLFVNAAEGTSGNELYFRNQADAKSAFTPMVSSLENDNTILFAKGNDVYILTNINSPNKRIVKADIKNPTPDKWMDIVPERKEVIETASIVGGDIFVQYLKDAASAVEQFNLEGKSIRKVELPGIGSSSGFIGEEDDTETFYGFESFTMPVTIYSYDIASGKSELIKQPKSIVDFDQFETTQVFYKSKDSTLVPMFIVCKKGTKLDGQNPTLLYGYGGFNISLSPYFSSRWLAWLDMGGVFALANIRGGGEYGEAWHEAGTKLKKQNVFDDFIAAAEYLEENKYTSSEKLTIMGGSNGGLLIGAVMTQRPDLMKVALPAVGVMDMLRFHKFTAGAGWITDYGCADSSKEMFEYIYKYSPVENVKPGVEYPATMVTTADHDDRVVPAHSFKFAAQLQANQAGTLPVLIRIDTKAGHGAGKSMKMVLDELADTYSFAFYNTNDYPTYYKE